jgi:D-glycero-alpha-D-manno-heptose-7-phosphate kinase
LESQVIITRTPLRISFVGGGSDRPSFYSEEPGACVAASIDKYCYVAVNEKYDGSIRAAYSITENVASVNELRHELMRAALNWFTFTGGIELHSIADIPGGTGLGSSSSFTVGAVAAIAAHVGQQMNASALAKMAGIIEIDECKKAIGLQDQYTAAYGGLNLLGFTSQGVTVSPIACDYEALSQHCLLLDTGLTRQGDAGAVLAGQQQDRDDVRTLAHLARSFAGALASGNYRLCGAQMDAAWEIKRQYCSTPAIDQLYAKADAAGAWGGKLCGAGGGGFLLFLAPPERHQAIIGALGLRHVPIRVGVKGCEVVYAST